MLTVPLFLLLAVVAAVALKCGAVKGGALTLGVALGLTLASTAVGPPVLAALNTATATAVHTVTAAMGGTK